ncbi:hypothetical protein R69746_05607 [Paraburkholderia aspalathi]|uniref:hypothetical protein n=1 Tax=Paraburkholderia aspalathi TaxID=1324617 RepID=UPI001909C4CB|nr:hypothetical protein [Paraburkholderia aspalathi]MBK3841765.1 hypothetical protein [Paraburkholderia aspalathi]CAE6810764.1 hypothetical protein R69746_05607 [Paraburkholderia aspalathi]
MSEVKTLGDALPDEIARVTGLIPIYASCGPVANIALALMRASLDRATRALAAGDVVAMVECLVDLQGYSA